MVTPVDDDEVDRLPRQALGCRESTEASPYNDDARQSAVSASQTVHASVSCTTARRLVDSGFGSVMPAREPFAPSLRLTACPGALAFATAPHSDLLLQGGKGLPSRLGGVR